MREISESAVPAGFPRPERVDREPSFVLGSRPWGETSLLLDVYTKSRGRVSVRARGAKRPASAFRGILSEFSPLLLSWRGSGPTKTLTAAVWLGGLAPVEGDALLSAFYANELLLRLTPREDPEEGIFTAYWELLQALAGSPRGSGLERALRTFEIKFLRLIGYGLPERYDSAWYVLDPPGLAAAGDSPPAGVAAFPAEALARIAALEFAGESDLRMAKAISRSVIAAVSGGEVLSTRRIMGELRSLLGPSEEQ